MATLLFTPALMAVALFILIPTSFLLILYVKTASSSD